MKTVNIKPYSSFDFTDSIIAEASVLFDFQQMEQMETDQAFESIRQNLILGTLTAGKVQTATSGKRVVIDGETNDIIIYNSSDEKTVIIDGAQTSVPSTPGDVDAGDSQMRIGGTMFLSSNQDAETNTGMFFWNGGFGASGVASFWQALGGSSTYGLMSIRSDGEMWHYGNGTSPVLVFTQGGGLGISQDILPEIDGTSKSGVDLGSATSPFQSIHISNDINVGDDIIMGGTTSRINMNGGDIFDCEQIGFDVTLVLEGTVATLDDDLLPDSTLEDLGDASATWDRCYADDFYGVYNAPSDKRLKTSIAKLDSALSTVSLLNPVSFKYKPKKYKKPSKKMQKEKPEKAARKEARIAERTAQKANEVHYGFIAQEVQEVLPDLVKENGEFLALKYTEIIPLLVKAIHELRDEINTIKNE